MFSNYRHFFHSNLLIIVALVAFFYTNVFPEKNETKLQDEQDFASLEIISEPENAHVFINRKDKGFTPCMLDKLTPGTYEISLQLSRFEEFKETIVLSKGDKKRIIVQLIKNYGELFIFSQPDSASVNLNGNYIGKTPINCDRLEPGTYTVELSLPNYSSKKITTNVKQREVDTLFATLEPLWKQLYGSVSISSIPNGATISMNKKKIGNTPFKSDSILPRNYNIMLSIPQYKPYKTTINVEKGKTYKVFSRLPSFAYLDSLKQIKREKFKTVRRWLFGSLTAGFAITGIIFNSKVSEAQKNEEKAWDDYMQLNLTPSEYDKLYKVYTQKVDKTNKIINYRNANFIIACIAGIGFVVSIPF